MPATFRGGKAIADAELQSLIDGRTTACRLLDQVNAEITSKVRMMDDLQKRIEQLDKIGNE